MAQINKIDELCATLDRISINTTSTSHQSKKQMNVKSTPAISSSINQEEKSSDMKEKALQNSSLSAEEKIATRKAKKEAKKENKGQKKEETKKENIEHTKEETVGCEKSKADLKKERRLMQEAQRAAKTEAKKQEVKLVTKTEETPINVAKEKLERVQKQKVKKKVIPLLDHLVRSESKTFDLNLIHYSFVRACCTLKTHIRGCNACVVTVLGACLDFINDYKTPEYCDLSRDLSSKINYNIEYMKAQVPFIQPMDNALRYLKKLVNNVESNVTDSVAKKQVMDAIRSYISQNIQLASKNIVSQLLKMVANKEVIITFGYSALFVNFAERAKAEGRHFTVVVVDVNMNGSGYMMVKKLQSEGIETDFIMVTDLKPIIKKVTFAIVESEAVAINGSIMGPCGMSHLLHAASLQNIPVLVMSQTYKFCNVHRTNSLAFNILENTDDFITKNTNGNTLPEKHLPNFNAIRLRFDLTPSKFVEKLITERGVLHTSMIPVIMERNFGDILCY